MKLKLLCGLAMMFALSGCLSLGMSGTANPTDATSVVVGASIDQSGTINPSGRVLFDLFN